MTEVLQCHQTILQPALIIGTLISGWHVNWSGYARLAWVRIFAQDFVLISMSDLTISAGTYTGSGKALRSKLKGYGQLRD